MSPSVVSAVLFLSPFNSFSPQPPNPLLLNPFPPLSFLPYFGGRGGPGDCMNSASFSPDFSVVGE
ncbi:MAG: hypothetical protein HXO15_03635 [Prevotella salivae]|nr:hypothetical protein [Segatella salivae]